MLDRSVVQQTTVEQGHVLSENQQSMLNFTFCAEDVKAAVFSIPGNKAPGLDGHGSAFYKAPWGTTGPDVTKAILKFFEDGKLLEEINATSITLIPKVK